MGFDKERITGQRERDSVRLIYEGGLSPRNLLQNIFVRATMNRLAATYRLLFNRNSERRLGL